MYGRQGIHYKHEAGHDETFAARMTSPLDLCSSFFSPIVSVTPDLVMSGRLLELSRVLVPFVKPCRVAPCREADAGSVIQDLGNRQQR